MIRIGIIGIGNMGTSHLKSFEEGLIPGFIVTAVADLRESRRAFVKDEVRADIAIFTEGADLIESGLCDAVLIATPHYQHPELSMLAFANNLHVMCEKPAGVYTKQVMEMNEAAKKCDKVFAMMYNTRTVPIYIKVKLMVENGELGRIRRVNWIITDWYRTQSYYNSGSWRATWEGEGGGVLLNQCPHNLDLLQWICGMPKKVQAFCHEGKWHDIEVEDDVTAYLEFPNGATGVFITSTGDAPGTNRLEITGTLGKLVCEDEKKLTFYKLDKNLQEHLDTCPEGFEKPECTEIDVEFAGETELHITVLKAFGNCIERGTPLIAKGEEGINGLELSNAMHLSSWLGQIVTLPIDADLFEAELAKKRASSRAKEEVDVVMDVTGTH